MIVIICGQSGSGKSTLRKALLKTHHFEKAQSYTTRPPRNDEQNGIDYNFVSQSFFDSLPNIFLKREDNGYMYGVDKTSFQKKNIISILDENGIAELSTHFAPSEIKIIYLNVPKKILIARLKQRGMNLTEIAQRFHRDKKLTFSNLRQRFPHLSIIEIDNSHNFSTTLQKSQKFIGITPLYSLKNTISKSNSSHR